MGISRRRLVWLLVVPVLFLVACQDEEADPSLVDQLRILAVQTDPPELQPGDLVTLSALVADPTGAGRTIDYAWGLCTVPFGERLSDCVSETASILSTDTAPTLSVPPDVLDGAPPGADVGVDLIVLLIVQAGQDTDEAVKRLRVSLSPAPNQNPAIESLDLTQTEPDTLDLAATATAESFEPFQQLGQTKTEEMRFTWLISSGTLERYISFSDDGRTGENTWDLTEIETPATLWVVMRDQRGGVSWAVSAPPP